MPYVDAFVLAVPRQSFEAYKATARTAGEVWQEFGALAYVECIGDDVPYGELTSFPRAVQTRARFPDRSIGLVLVRENHVQRVLLHRANSGRAARGCRRAASHATRWRNRNRYSALAIGIEGCAAGGVGPGKARARENPHQVHMIAQFEVPRAIAGDPLRHWHFGPVVTDRARARIPEEGARRRSASSQNLSINLRAAKGVRYATEPVSEFQWPMRDRVQVL